MKWIEINQTEEREVRKVYCDHRGGLSESLSTTISCPNGVDGLKIHLAGRYIVKFKINDDPHEDDRLPDFWGKVKYPVIGVYADGSQGVVGWCNFLE